MASHDITALAVAARAAIESSAAVDAAARTVLDALPPADYTRHVDVGANLVIVIRPGFSPLKDPSEFVALSHEVN